MSKERISKYSMYLTGALARAIRQGHNFLSRYTKKQVNYVFSKQDKRTLPSLYYSKDSS